MHIISVSLVLATIGSCVPRSPRIYNVLISSKKNLAPSQAVPVYEPVLKTTSVGLAFTPLIYSPGITIESSSSRYVPEGPKIQDTVTNQNQTPGQEIKTEIISENYVQLQSVSNGIKNLSQNVVLQQQYIPYYTSSLHYEPYYQKQQQNIPKKGPATDFADVSNPKQIVANLKKNSDIPDVLPPPLPVKHL